RRHIDRDAVEPRRGAVRRIVGATQGADPLDLAGAGMNGAVNDVIRRMCFDGGGDGFACPCAVFLVDPRVGVLEGDARVWWKEEVLLDPFVPVQVTEGQVAIPEADAGDPAGVVQPGPIAGKRVL